MDPRWAEPIDVAADGTWENPFTYAGGDGSSLDEAVEVVDVPNPIWFARAATLWVGERYPGSETGPDRMMEAGDRHYVIMWVEPPEGDRFEVYFDDTDAWRLSPAGRRRLPN